MKKIKILQSNIEPLLIEDDSNIELGEYVSDLSKLLSVGNVSILETSTTSIILRPRQIISIVVTEDGKSKRKVKSKKKVEIKEDLITDV